MSRAPGIKIHPEIIDRCGRAASVGANVGTLAEIAGIGREQFWRWRKAGEQDEADGIDSDPARLVKAIRDGKAKDAMACLAVIAKAASKGDVRAAMWKLERTHGYGPDGDRADAAPPVADPAAVLTPDEQLAAAKSLPPDVLRRALLEAEGGTDADLDR